MCSRIKIVDDRIRWGGRRGGEGMGRKRWI